MLPKNSLVGFVHIFLYASSHPVALVKSAGQEGRSEGKKSEGGGGKIANHPRENLKKVAIRGSKGNASQKIKIRGEKRRCLMTMLSFLGAVLGNGTAGTKSTL